MSDAQKGHEVSFETRKKLAQANLGSRHSDETRAKMRATAKIRREREALLTADQRLEIKIQRREKEIDDLRCAMAYTQSILELTVKLGSADRNYVNVGG